MKKKLSSGIGLVFLLLLAIPVFADPVRESSELRARLSLTNSQNNTEILAFTSTSAANDAATLMQGSGNTLTFASYGRVPFYQILTIASNSSSHSSSALNSTAVPEPMSLFLLGSGLSAFALGLRKKKKNKLETV